MGKEKSLPNLFRKISESIETQNREEVWAVKLVDSLFDEEQYVDNNFPKRVCSGKNSLCDPKKGEIYIKEGNGWIFTENSASGGYSQVPKEFGDNLDKILQQKLEELKV